MAGDEQTTEDPRLALSWGETSDMLSAVLRVSQESTDSVQQPIDPQTDTNTLQLSTFRFLDLPHDIRVLIYVELFSKQTLEPFSKAKGWKAGLCTAHSFRPVEDETPCYGLLLANRRCFNEGIKHYYQNCIVLNPTCISKWEFEAKVSQHSYTEEQRFTVSHRPNRTQEVVLAQGITSNAWLVIENVRRIVATSRMFHIEGRLTYFESLQDVLIKMPRMEWDHWPELQEIISPNTRPSDNQLRFFHEGVLPRHELPRRFVKGLRRRTHVGYQETMEDELVTVMQSMPQTAFRARIPVTYKYDDEEIWEVSF